MMNTADIVLRIAWRNLWRNYRRTLIMFVAILVGVWAMIIMIAAMRGMIDGMVQDGIRTLPGHVQIHHPEYRDDPTVENLIQTPGGDLAAALAGSGVVAWSGRVRVPAVISSERSTRGVTLVGIDPFAEAPVSFIADAVVDGRYLEDESDAGLILGRRLLEELETEVGRRVVVMTQSPGNDIADRGFRIVGAFEAELAATEEGFAFAGRRTLQDALGIGSQVSEIAVLGEHYRQVEPLRQRIEAAAGSGSEVRAWDEINSYLGTMTRTMDGFVVVWIGVVFLALSFGLVNTLVMAVFERFREIGLMMALGMKPAIVLGQIIAESLMLLTMGLSAGIVLALITTHALRDGIDFSVVGEGLEMMGAASVLVPSLQFGDVVLSAVVVLALGFLASLGPAIRAARCRPVEAIART